jgi:serine/threonine protein kinase
MTTLAPGVELRTYRVEASLGGGGHALTWRATDTRSGRAVVIKQFRLADAPDWKGHALFLRECAVLRSLAHPAIPAYVDAFEEATGADSGVPELFLVQEFVDAPNLAALLGEGRRWSEDALVALARQALSILDWLHTRHPPVITGT